MPLSDSFNSLRRKARGGIARLKDKGWFYWATVVILIVVGIKLGGWLEVQDFAIIPRYRIYQAVQEQGPRHPFVQRTVVVLIGDEEYWKGELARRVPIKRDYLAKLVSALDQADPAVIALDFDLRSQTPDGTFVQYKDYEGETSQLLSSITNVSKNRWIVIPKTLNFSDGFYESDSDVYDHHNFEGGNLSKGYIALPSDVRKLPLRLTVKDGSELDSFAVAIVRAANEAALRPVKDDKELPFLRYLPADSFERLSATKVLEKDPDTWRKIRHNIVIVGAGWSTLAYGRGRPVDTYFTPLGPLPGVLLHANYVEALLDNRTSKPYAQWALNVIEGMMVLVIAVIFALLSSPISRVIGVVLVAAALVLYGYLSLLVLGLFYDFFVPVLLVLFHAISEWIESALSRRRRQSRSA